MRWHRSNKLNMSHSHMMLVHCQRVFIINSAQRRNKNCMHSFDSVVSDSHQSVKNEIGLNWMLGGESCARFNISHERGVEVMNSFNGVWMLVWALLKTLWIWTTGRHRITFHHRLADSALQWIFFFFGFSFSFLQRQHISLADSQKCMRLVLLAEINQINQTSIFFTAKKQQTNEPISTPQILQSAVQFICYQSHEPILFILCVRARILLKPEIGTSSNCQASVIMYNWCLLLLAHKKTDVISLVRCAAVSSRSINLIESKRCSSIAADVNWFANTIIHCTFWELKFVYKLKACKFPLRIFYRNYIWFCYECFIG